MKIKEYMDGEEVKKAIDESWLTKHIFQSIIFLEAAGWGKLRPGCVVRACITHPVLSCAQAYVMMLIMMILHFPY